MKLPVALCKLRRDLQVWDRGTRHRTHYKLNKRFIRYFKKHREEVLSLKPAELESFYIYKFYGFAWEQMTGYNSRDDMKDWTRLAKRARTKWQKEIK